MTIPVVVEEAAMMAANGVFLAAMYLIPYVVWASIDENLKHAIEFKDRSNWYYSMGRFSFYILLASLTVLSLYGLCHVVVSS